MFLFLCFYIPYSRFCLRLKFLLKCQIREIPLIAIYLQFCSKYTKGAVYYLPHRILFHFHSCLNSSTSLLAASVSLLPTPASASISLLPIPAFNSSFSLLVTDPSLFNSSFSLLATDLYLFISRFSLLATYPYLFY